MALPVPRGAYPCADGHYWAEPDLEAELCRQVLASYRERFSFASVGARYPGTAGRALGRSRERGHAAALAAGPESGGVVSGAP
ncbi:hypothetical protein [Vulcanococcus sp.]|uniref:hypothetical protein n=1 Tax=Vulcanococcus sp. TaxID=2856995 RepID=UPI003F69BB2E